MTSGWSRLRFPTLALGAYLGIAGAYGALQLIRGVEPLLSWLGLALAALAALAGLLMDLRDGATADRPSLPATAFSGLGLAITMAISWRYGPAAGWVHGWAGLAFVGWVAYGRWLRQPKA